MPRRAIRGKWPRWSDRNFRRLAFLAGAGFLIVLVLLLIRGYGIGSSVGVAVTLSLFATSLAILSRGRR